MSGGGVFRKKSLERLSSPERLDHLLEVVDRKTWIPLCTLGLLLAGLVVWAVVATVPIHVEGKGILVRPRKIVEFEAPGAGRVVRLEVAIGDEVRRGQLLAKIERPDLEARLKLQREKAGELMRENLAAAPRIGGGSSGEALTLRDYLDRGGFLFAEGYCGGAGFDVGFRELMTLVFPENVSVTRIRMKRPWLLRADNLDPRLGRSAVRAASNFAPSSGDIFPSWTICKIFIRSIQNHGLPIWRDVFGNNKGRGLTFF